MLDVTKSKYHHISAYLIALFTFPSSSLYSLTSPVSGINTIQSPAIFTVTLVPVSNPTSRNHFPLKFSAGVLVSPRLGT